MKRTANLLIAMLGICLVSLPTAVNALSVTPQTLTATTTPDVVITSLGGSELLDFVEIYNQSDAPINLEDWQIKFTVHSSGCSDITFQTDKLSGWLLSKNYLSYIRSGTTVTGSSELSFDVDDSSLSGCASPQLSSVEVVDNNENSEQTISVPSSTLTGANWAQHKQRSNTSSTRTITNNFTSDYSIKSITASVQPTLLSDPLYFPPTNNSGLKILEILPNPRQCSPTLNDLTCTDYIKLYNPTNHPINLANYRLRVGYQGQSSSVTNTFTWGQNINPASDELDLNPHKYFTLMTRNDGLTPLSITDDGGYVWLEDVYGVKIYDPVVQYPSASSTTKVGQAWADDGVKWRWTSAPRPTSVNYFPTVAAVSVTVATSALVPCRADQYRSPDTNRCRLLVVSASTLVPCKPNQTRNPDTNRCRSVLAASTTLKPCAAGYIRNTDTNRCRKSTAGGGIASVKDIKSATKVSKTGWLIAGAAIVCAIAYALYEWRQEALGLFNKSWAKVKK